MGGPALGVADASNKSLLREKPCVFLIEIAFPGFFRGNSGRCSALVRRSFLRYFKPQHAFPTTRIMSNDRVVSGAGNKRLRGAGVLQFLNTFALRVTKLDRRTAKRQRNQLS